MSSMNEVLQQSMNEIPECMAAGYVDMSTGMLLAVDTVESHPQEVLDMVAAATSDLFQGKNVVTIEQMFKSHRGIEDDGSHYFQEILVFSDNLLHVFMRAKQNPDHALVYVCNESVNVGMALTKARMQLGKVEDAL